MLSHQESKHFMRNLVLSLVSLLLRSQRVTFLFAHKDSLATPPPCPQCIARKGDGIAYVYVLTTISISELQNVRTMKSYRPLRRWHCCGRQMHISSWPGTMEYLDIPCFIPLWLLTVDNDKKNGPETNEIVTHICSCITFFPFLLWKYFWYQHVAYCVCFKMIYKKSL